MSEELLPCPFCGEGDKVTVADNTGPKLCTSAHAFVMCNRCHTDGPERDTVELAIAAWNTRPALIDHLEADGMVLVPREPTEAMLQAGALNLFGSASEDWRDDAREVWSAMLSALPVLGVGR